jgi:hypothetical protein
MASNEELKWWNNYSNIMQQHWLLSPYGSLFIGVPNIGSLQAKLFGSYWWNLGPPVHPFNYSGEILIELFENNGFKVIKYRTNSNFAGILGSIQMFSNKSSGRKGDDGYIHRNPFAKILTQWLVKFLDIFNVGDSMEIIAKYKL